MTKCSISSCPGEYEKKHILHTVKHHERVIVIENVPAEVCSVCGDVLLSVSTVEAIEAMLENPGEPVRSAPVYKMPGEAAA
ncbi:MAG: YgiT-type zinc finger protein [Syntrophobacteraceae bacterium]